MALHQRMFSGNKINIVRKKHPLFLGYLNEQLCAYASAQLSQKEGRLLYLGVDEKYRQQGIATALMAQVWNFLHDSCQDKIALVQSDKAQAAGKLYKKLGFKTIRRLLSAQLIVN
nr:GNAT family N-acetyltransferase [Oenococcus oeni]